MQGDEQFRASHFKPLRDFSRITSHIVTGVFRRGSIPAVFRSIRANPALIDDAERLIAPAPGREAISALDDGTL
ncbi:hypothetical protein D3C80_1907520 [compost metagenome]